MGAHDSAGVCELVGTLSTFQYNKKDIGLYRDEDLVAFKNKRSRQAIRIKKDFQKSFRENALSIAIKSWRSLLIDVVIVQLMFQTGDIILRKRFQLNQR